MNTYMVEINARFLVKIELEGSCCAAEHYFLDNYYGVWGANAYDEKAMKTECFRGAVLTSEIVSLNEFEQIFTHLYAVKCEADSLKDDLKPLEDELATLQAEYDRVKGLILKKHQSLAAKREEHKAALDRVNADERYKA